ncbi:ARHGDIB, partial [Cervus elaphus hippelaphus]
MTEKAPEPHVEEDDDELDGKLNYKPPPQKSLKELQEMDKDDESLTKYKKTLLGDGPVVAGDLEALKKENFVLKEGVEYRVKINFKVNKDIVSGLKYVQHTYRTGVKDGPGAQEPVHLTDVQAAMEFIAAAEVAVIGFFQDLEVPAVSLIQGVVQNFQDVSFGISTASEVLAHYNITGNTISLFRL